SRIPRGGIWPDRSARHPALGVCRTPAGRRRTRAGLAGPPGAGGGAGTSADGGSRTMMLPRMVLTMFVLLGALGCVQEKSHDKLVSEHGEGWAVTAWGEGYEV